MNIKLNEALAVIEDNESIKAVLTEIYQNIEELQNERDRYKIKALARKVELKHLKESIGNGIEVDNFTMNYTDYRGYRKTMHKSFLDKKVFNVFIVEEVA